MSTRDGEREKQKGGNARTWGKGSSPFLFLRLSGRREPHRSRRVPLESLRRSKARKQKAPNGKGGSAASELFVSRKKPKGHGGKGGEGRPSDGTEKERLGGREKAAQVNRSKVGQQKGAASRPKRITNGRGGPGGEPGSWKVLRVRTEAGASKTSGGTSSKERVSRRFTGHGPQPDVGDFQTSDRGGLEAGGLSS